LPKTAKIKSIVSALAVGAGVLALGGMLSASDQEERIITQQDCSLTVQPEEFLARESRTKSDTFERAARFSKAFARSSRQRSAVNAADLPRQNFIDEAIFSKLAEMNVPAAAISTDEEFLRRVTLDLTGKIPTPQEIRDFVADPDPGKRTIKIERLLYTPEFSEKWTQWLGDLLQNTVTLSTQAFSNQIEGRNRMHEWLLSSVESGKSLRELATEAVTGSGNTYDRPGASNFALKGSAAMGPVQDHYDMLLSKTATAFLGMAHYDCLLCHDGRRHVDTLSVWAKSVTRADAQKMAAFFSRIRYARHPETSNTGFYFNSYNVTDATTGQYDLNTTSGNRPSRVTMNGNTRVNNYTPMYRDGKTPRSGNWRQEFAQLMVDDPMFARNMANRIWKQMFNLALAEPVDQLDPDRLDPNKELPAGWSYQASNPQLLERLAEELRNSDYNLRKFVSLLANSTAYQLSSRYDGEWKIDYVPLFARHYPRRLEAEEVHDALVKASGNLPSYTIGGWVDPARWAMQFPDTIEPRSNGTVAGFLNTFSRGNRDTQQRSQSGSILMSLNLMNSSFVMDRITVARAPNVAAIARNTSNEAVVDDLFLLYLSRKPTEYERGIALRQLGRSGTAQYSRNAAVEDLAWALVNKADFLFSY